MPISESCRVAALAVGACLGAPAAASAAVAPLAPATVYATYAQATNVTATGGWTAWSTRRAAGWRLMLRSPKGTVTEAPVPLRAIPFDASLGERSGGRVALAYSRCVREPSKATGGVVLAWHSARGCSVHLLDVVSGRDRTLKRTPGARADVLPAVRGTRVAYASLPARGATGSILTRPVAGGRPTRLYSGPARRTVTGSSDIAEGPQAVAVDATHTAFTWVRETDQGVAGGLSTFETRLLSSDGRNPTVLLSAGGAGGGSCTGYTDLRSLTLAGGNAISEVVSPVGWELQRVALQQPRKVRERRASARVTYGTGLSDPEGGYLPSVAVDGARIALTAPAPGGGIAVGALPLGAFGSKSRLDDAFGCT